MELRDELGRLFCACAWWEGCVPAILPLLHWPASRYISMKMDESKKTKARLRAMQYGQEQVGLV